MSTRRKVLSYSGVGIALVFYIGILIGIRIVFPDINQLLVAITSLYKTYGYFLVFFGALFESMFMIGLYIPGSAVVLIVAAVSRTGVLSFPLVFLFGTTGLVCGYIINYLLGRYGWFHILSGLGLEKAVGQAKEKLTKHRIKTLLVAYCNPAAGSFVSTAAGILKIPFWEYLFFAVLFQSIWALIWGTLAYFFGLLLVELIIKYSGFVVAGIVIIWFLVEKYRH